MARDLNPPSYTSKPAQRSNIYLLMPPLYAEFLQKSFTNRESLSEAILAANFLDSDSVMNLLSFYLAHKLIENPTYLSEK